MCVSLKVHVWEGWLSRGLFPRLFVMLNDFANDEFEKFLSKIGIEIGTFRQTAQPFDLFFFTRRVRRRQIMFGFERADLFGLAKAFGQSVDEDRVEIINRLAVMLKLLFWVMRAAPKIVRAGDDARFRLGDRQKEHRAFRKSHPFCAPPAWNRHCVHQSC